ncbi:hypothetical protein [Arenimonas oryziterrae]|uniref:Uncharacterized protein n=1 Tax=Arenimonas oryziterrae DSM 21050 = YC6267 TaxID=1121015 RepID=A0A091ATH6_9GAMM|nr:hypothetical protein [Arenimonas oryziterrae]KFN42319.1 hypothetical protein N789_14090 [Arenimonas oryziterrae DSM 21050 = YC6267]
MCDFAAATAHLRQLEKDNMADQDEITGPDFLDTYADRLEANGLNIEAGLMRKRAREWSLERQAFADGAPPPANVKPTSGKAFSANVSQVNFDQGTVTLRPEGKEWLGRTAGRYHLIPVANAA